MRVSTAIIQSAFKVQKAGEIFFNESYAIRSLCEKMASFRLEIAKKMWSSKTEIDIEYYDINDNEYDLDQFYEIFRYDSKLIERLGQLLDEKELSLDDYNYICDNIIYTNQKLSNYINRYIKDEEEKYNLDKYICSICGNIVEKGDICNIGDHSENVIIHINDL